MPLFGFQPYGTRRPHGPHGSHVGTEIFSPEYLEHAEYVGIATGIVKGELNCRDYDLGKIISKLDADEDKDLIRNLKAVCAASIAKPPPSPFLDIANAIASGKAKCSGYDADKIINSLDPIGDSDLIAKVKKACGIAGPLPPRPPPPPPSILETAGPAVAVPPAAAIAGYIFAGLKGSLVGGLAGLAATGAYILYKRSKATPGTDTTPRQTR